MTSDTHPLPTCWIKTIDDSKANDQLKAIYKQIGSSTEQVDNLYRAFSLRPHMIKPADDVYKAALHHPDNRCRKVDSELFGCYVAILTQCGYALTHHGHNYGYLLGDHTIAEQHLQALSNGDLGWCNDTKIVSALNYVKKLTTSCDEMTQSDVVKLQQSGWDDGEILEIVQIVAMFKYFVSVINGLGIQLHGETIGAY